LPGFSPRLIVICQKVRILNQKSGYMDKITEELSFSKYNTITLLFTTVPAYFAPVTGISDHLFVLIGDMGK
jgi:hypothetical protein